VVWLSVTFLTPPEPAAVLERFYRRVRPGGRGWRPVAERLGFGDDPIPGGALSYVNWFAGVIAVFTALFAVGAFLTGTRLQGWLYSLAAIGSFLLIQRNLRADPTLRTAVDTTARPELGLDR
jgi:solute:Na+ symporter, SSS family